MGDLSVERLDNFTDAAFAFALSWLLIGQDGAPTSIAELQAGLANLPAFAIGFGIIAMFWVAHLRWRRLRGAGGTLSKVLTLALVFLVLVYIRPLQGMALSLSTYLGGSGTRFIGGLGELFLIYGAGFAAMSATMMGLFFEARRDDAVSPAARREALGEGLIWGMCVATALLSVALAAGGAGFWSPWVYATLPITVPILAWRFPWAPPVDVNPQPAEQGLGASETETR